MSIRVLVVDDQALVRAGFRKLLDAVPGVEVVGEAADGTHAVRLSGLLRPDVVLMDVRMPGTDGITATRRIVESCGADVRVLMLTTFPDDQYVLESLRAGASGFLLKDAPPEQLVDAIGVVARGDALLDPAVTRTVIASVADTRPAPTPSMRRRLAGLTDRELTTLELLATGMSNLEIARHLVLSEATVKTHVGHLLTKLGLRDRVQAVIFAFESGVVGGGGSGPAPGRARRDLGRKRTP